MDKSKFSMWRASFAFCHIDSVFSSEEREWIETKIKILPFSEEEKSIIVKDMATPPKIDNILIHISNPIDKGFLVNEIRKLALIDKKMSSAEKDQIEKIKNIVMSKIDVTDLENKVLQEKIKNEDNESVLGAFFSRNR